MLPFLIKSRPDVEIVPIALGRLSLNRCLELGERIGAALSDWDRDVLLLASSDMNHFSPAATTEELDRMAIAP